jgi:hypothetical protein
VGESHLPPELVQAGRDARLSVSVAQVYLGLSPGTPIPEDTDILFLSGEPVYDAAAYRKYPPTCRSYSFYHPRHIRPDHDRAEIVASMCANFSDWDGLAPDAYRARKREMIDAVVAELEARHPGLSARIDKASWQVPAIFDEIAQAGHVNEHDMFGTFNMGIGLVVAVAHEGADEAVAILSAAGDEVSVIGEIVPGEGEVLL